MIYQKFHQSLKSHGVLFIGSTEQITNYKELGFDRLSSFYFEKLPLIENVELLRNIIYSGIWTKFELIKKKRMEEKS